VREEDEVPDDHDLARRCNPRNATVLVPRPPSGLFVAVTGDDRPYVGICDGCAQSADECLCGLDLDEVRDCSSVYHPGCRDCEVKSR